MPFDVNETATYLKQMIPNLNFKPNYAVPSKPMYLNALIRGRSCNAQFVKSNSTERDSSEDSSLEDSRTVTENGEHLHQQNDINQPVSEETVENQDNSIENEESSMEIDENEDSYEETVENNDSDGRNDAFESEEDRSDSDAEWTVQFDKVFGVDQSMSRSENVETQTSEQFPNVNQENSNFAGNEPTNESLWNLISLEIEAPNKENTSNESLPDLNPVSSDNGEIQRDLNDSNHNAVQWCKTRVNDEYTALVCQSEAMKQEFQLKLAKMTQLIEEKRRQLAGFSGADK